MQIHFKKYQIYDIFGILKERLLMNKKTRKLLVWIMLLLMVASAIAGIIVYFIS